MTGAPDRLGAECTALTRYLIGTDPSPYVVARYRAAHERDLGLEPGDRFDALLVRWAVGSRFLRRPVAAFARRYASSGALQAKLVLLLALLETSAPSFLHIDSVPVRNGPALAALVALRGVWAVLALILGVVLLTPIRWSLQGKAIPG